MRVNIGCGQVFRPGWHNLDVAPASPLVQQHDVRQGLPFPSSSVRVVYSSHVLEHLEPGAARVFLRDALRVLQPGGVLRLVVPDLENIARAYLQSVDAVRAGDPRASRRHAWMQLELLDQLVRDRAGGSMLSFWQDTGEEDAGFIRQRVGEEAAPHLGRTAKATTGPGSLRRLRNSVVRAVLGDAFEWVREARFRASGEVHRWMYDEFSLGALLAETGFSDVKRETCATSRIPAFADEHLDTLPDGTVRKPDSLFMEGVKR